MIALKYNDIPAAFQLIRAGCRLDPEEWLWWCNSADMCKLLLALDVSFSIRLFASDAVLRILILNGRYAPAFDWTRLEEQVAEDRIELRRDFVHIRKLIVTLLGVKTKRGKLPSIDRFVVREIALSVWASRYDPLPKKPARLSPYHVQLPVIYVAAMVVHCLVGNYAVGPLGFVSGFGLYRDAYMDHRSLVRLIPFIFGLVMAVVLMYATHAVEQLVSLWWNHK